MSNAAAANKTHSVALVAVGGEFIVSCFALDDDGQPDTDGGEVFVRSFTDEERAGFFFADSAKLLACNAERMHSEIRCVESAISSLKSCVGREVLNESRILARCVARLQVATLARKHSELEALKATVLGYASAALAAAAPRAIVAHLHGRSAELIANDR
jgi:hypothetical protein